MCYKWKATTLAVTLPRACSHPQLSYNYEGESCVLWKTRIIPYVEWTTQSSLQLWRVDGSCFLVWRLQFAFRFFSLPLHCSTGWHQACARGSKLQPHPNSPKSPRLEDQCLEYTKYSPWEEGRAGSSSTRWQELLLPVLWSLKGSTASCPFQEARLAMPAEAEQINTSKQSPQETRVQIRQQQYQDTYVQSHLGGWEMWISWSLITLLKILFHF